MTFGVTQRFRDAYEQNHLAAVAGILLSPDGTAIGDPLLFDTAAQNTVAVDVTAANRRQCQLSLADPEGVLTPLTADSALSLVNEIALYRGIHYGDGDDELCPLGIFGIQTAVEAESQAGPTVAVSGIDRSKRLDVNLSHGFAIAAGTTFDVLFTKLADASGVIYDKYFDPEVIATTTPAIIYNAGDNIWQQIQTAASSLGCWAYFDVDGTFTVVPVPDPDGQPVDWVYAAGATAMFDEVERTLALEAGNQKAYSHAVVRSAVHKTGAPLRSDAFDADPSSPTYWLGPFGDRPIFDDNVSSFITTQAQCDRAAAALLRRNYGILESVTLRAAPNPALSGGDVVAITDPKSDTDSVYIAEQFSVPLFAAGGTTTITFRSRQLH